MNEFNLIEQAKKGDRKAFEQIFTAQNKQLYHTAYSYVHNREDTLDIIQETACIAYLSINKLRKNEYFGTWLTRILINEAYKVLRKKKPNLVDLKDNEMDSIATLSDFGDNRMMIEVGLKGMRENYQTVIRLYYFRDYSIKEIADIMRRPESTVKTYLRRAKQKLRENLEEVSHEGSSISEHE
ncbi:hypothetical protein ASG97_20925 [Bacillus sp. Soil745]|uniref:sigma-70 family RNA polymerase sigma factor n=1 Tax=Peribacillus frigoritolerans TaxID=450367 RepID=UPI00070C371E|nr:sigma-70 family RNA polymerase sigma factor [Peribacillus frigoritolerans]KRF59437.1 hypothetical protein ASG97_20925 [Bacillus sp. Soil745]MED3889595.1 sigma-70 family RNA polymerase sigma factor [Peribacillus frigoritolerans]PAW26245.1 hypothetical protein BKC07_25965 [Peribacillus simplex]ULM97522.1 sigma-70 family RNA polymerase sigma factor [Peribacillus frigoritolerans]